MLWKRKKHQPKPPEELAQLRQGDVFIEEINEVPANLKLKKGKRDERGRIVLAEGEVTGHAHAIHEEAVDILVDDVSGEIYLEVHSPATIVHEEHGPIELPPGLYKSSIQEEYNPDDVNQRRKVFD